MPNVVHAAFPGALLQLVAAVRSHGIRGATACVWQRMFPSTIEGFTKLLGGVASRTGLEIGGPSAIFSARGMIPVYPIAAAIDNCNFSADTVWQGCVQAGRSFRYSPHRAPGIQFITEASRMDGIGSETYDFILSSHVIEHLANPVAGMREWLRVLKTDGLIVLVAPHRDRTFDHRRPLTTLSHMAADADTNTSEDDLTHLPEVLALHDLRRDPGVRDKEHLEERSRRNLFYRCIHHHVFDTHLLVELTDFVGLQVIAVEARLPHHSIVIARKTAEKGRDNSPFLSADAAYRRQSPFRSDRDTAGAP